MRNDYGRGSIRATTTSVGAMAKGQVQSSHDTSTIKDKFLEFNLGDMVVPTVVGNVR